ncbi:MAG: TRAP transporter large permease subunit [Wenzhouxiangella sp.]|nr:MAG: TRAP transporter large permease subunit [Wenzhouxiangella sp.]
MAARSCGRDGPGSGSFDFRRLLSVPGLGESALPDCGSSARFGRAAGVARLGPAAHSPLRLFADERPCSGPGTGGPEARDRGMNLLLILAVLAAARLSWFAALVLAAFGFYFVFDIDPAVIAMEMRRIGEFELLAIVALLLLGGQLSGSAAGQRCRAGRQAGTGASSGLRALNVMLRVADAIFLSPMLSGTKNLLGRPGGPIDLAAAREQGATVGDRVPVRSVQAVAGRLFAPSIYLLLVASMLEVVAPAQARSLQALLLAGLLPALTLLAASVLLPRSGAVGYRFSPSVVDLEWRGIVLARLLPLLLVIGLYAGFWPPFAAACAIALALGLNLLLAGQLRGIDWPAATARALLPFGAIGLLFALGLVWSAVMADSGLSDAWISNRVASGQGQTALALAVAAAWLSAAALLRPLPALILCAPILFPMALRGGLAPEQLVVLTVLALAIGGTWPAVRADFRPSPVEAVSLLGLAAVALWPAFTLWLPALIAH